MPSLPVVTAAAVWLTLLTARATATRIAVCLPATILHELAHWLVAFVLGGNPGLPSLWPRREGRMWVLGSVSFHATHWTAGWVALAPFWILVPVAHWALFLHSAPGLLEQVATGALAGFALWGCIPSSTDFEVALRYPLGTFPAMALCITWVWLYAL